MKRQETLEQSQKWGVRENCSLLQVVKAFKGSAWAADWQRLLLAEILAGLSTLFCQYDANKSSYTPYGDGRSPISAGIQEGFQSVMLLNDCMRSRGYYLTDRAELENKKAKYEQSKNEFKLAIEIKDYNKALAIVNRVINDDRNASGPYHDRGMVHYFREV